MSYVWMKKRLHTAHTHKLVGGLNPSEKYEFVSWDDEIPNIWKNKNNVPNHQPAKVLVLEELYRKRLCFVLFAHESLGLRCPEQWKENQEQRHHKSKSGWWFQPLQKILVSWDSVGMNIIPNIWNKKCSKLLTRNSYGLSLTKMSETMRDISGELPFDDILGIINISSTVTVDTIAVHYPHRIWNMTKDIIESWLYDLKIHDEKPWITVMQCHTRVYYLTPPKKWTV